MSAMKDDIERFNGFLRGERAAVETYRQCIASLKSPKVVEQLSALRDSHQKRVIALTEQIALMGGVSDSSSGTWGAFAKLFEGGASLFGDATAIAALETGEKMGNSDYKSVSDLMLESRVFVTTQLVPEQRNTREGMRRLREVLEQP